MDPETHSLLMDGAPFDKNVQYIEKKLGADGTGFGVCSCGAASPEQLSDQGFEGTRAPRLWG